MDTQSLDLLGGNDFASQLAIYKQTGYKNVPLNKLYAAAGTNPFASLELAKKYLAGSNSERSTGMQYLNNARKILETIANTDYNAVEAREHLVKVLLLQGHAYESGLLCPEENVNSPEDAKHAAFVLYQNAHEIDESQYSDLIRCYRNGIGVERDEEKAEQLQESVAYNGGIQPKLDYALNMLVNGQTLKAATYLQSGLESSDAANHPDCRAAARFILSCIGETDENGQNIDLNRAFSELNSYGRNETATKALDVANTLFPEKVGEIAAANGGIREGVQYAMTLVNKGDISRAIEWFQKGLLSNDAANYPSYRAAARLLLSCIGETDENGNGIDFNAAYDEIKAYANDRAGKSAIETARKWYPAKVLLSEANSGGIVPKVEYALYLFKSGNRDVAIQWLQAGLFCEDAQIYTEYSAAAQYILAYLGQTGKSGNSPTIDEAYTELRRNSGTFVADETLLLFPPDKYVQAADTHGKSAHANHQNKEGNGKGGINPIVYVVIIIALIIIAVFGWKLLFGGSSDDETESNVPDVTATETSDVSDSQEEESESENTEGIVIEPSLEPTSSPTIPPISDTWLTDIPVIRMSEGLMFSDSVIDTLGKEQTHVLYASDDYGPSTADAVFQTDGKYDSITVTYGCYQNSPMEIGESCFVVFYADGNPAGSIEIKNGLQPQEIEIPLNYCSTFEIVFYNHFREIFLSNIQLHNSTGVAQGKEYENEPIATWVLLDIPCTMKNHDMESTYDRDWTITLNNGRVLHNALYTSYDTFSSRSEQVSSSYYLEGKYSTLTGVLGKDEEDMEYTRYGTCNIYCDDVLVWTHEGSPNYGGNGLPVEFQIDVSGCQVIRFEISSNSGDVLGDLRVYPAQ